MLTNSPSVVDDSSLDSSAADTHATSKLLARLHDNPAAGTIAITESSGGAMAKRIYDLRRRREKLFYPDLFGEPAWDILLILYWATSCQQRLSVSNVCAFASVPPTTALRWIERLIELGMLARQPHPTDRRVSWLTLSAITEKSMDDYFRPSSLLVAPSDLSS